METQQQQSTKNELVKKAINGAQGFQQEIMQKSSRLSLWNFLLDLLGMKNSDHLIVWTNQDKLEFRFVDPKEIAFLWGHLNGKDNMTYAKFSRAIRYYYGKGVLEKIPNQRFYYRFVRSIKTKFAMETTFKITKPIVEKTEQINPSNNNAQPAVNHRKRPATDIIQGNTVNCNKDTTNDTLDWLMTELNANDTLNPESNSWIENIAFINTPTNNSASNNYNGNTVKNTPMEICRENLNLPSCRYTTCKCSTDNNKYDVNKLAVILEEETKSSNISNHLQTTNHSVNVLDDFSDIPNLNREVSIQELSKIFPEFSQISNPPFEYHEDDSSQSFVEYHKDDSSQSFDHSEDNFKSYYTNPMEYNSSHKNSFTPDSVVSPDTQTPGITSTTQTFDILYDLMNDASFNNMENLMNIEIENMFKTR